MGSGFRRNEGKGALSPATNYPEDVANGNTSRYQPEEGTEGGVECQADSQAEIEDHQSKYEEQDVSDDSQHAAILRPLKRGTVPFVWGWW